MMRWTPLLAALVAASAGGVHAAHDTQPQRLRLALGDTSSVMQVVWETDTQVNDSAVLLLPLAEPLRGGSPALHASAAAGGWVIAPETDAYVVYGSALQQRSVWVHKAVLVGLAPGQRYRYVVGSDAGGWSAPFEFRAQRPPAAFTPEAPLRLLAYCDMGDARALALPAVQRELLRTDVEYDAVLHCGDFAYDMDDEDGAVAERFLSAIEPVAARVPLLVSPGNHEQARNFSAFRRRFAVPGDAEGLFWSVDIGPLHLVSYNTEVFFWPQHFRAEHMAAQHAWLAADLAAADGNRAAVPWVLTAAHRPMYCVSVGASGHCSAEHVASRTGVPMQCAPGDAHACARAPAAPGAAAAAAAAGAFSPEALMRQHGVDIAVFGHYHCYERYWPVHDEQVLNSSGVSAHAYVAPLATVHVTTGAGGNREMLLGPAPPPRGWCGSPAAAPWCAYQAGYAPAAGQSADYSFSRVTVWNATHAHWSQWSVTLGSEVDAWWLVRPSGRPAWSSSGGVGGVVTTATATA